MKKIGIFVFLLLGGGLTSAAVAQANVTPRDFSVRITNRRGKPVSSVVVQSTPGGEVGITDKDGRYVFSAVSPEEQIILFLPRQGEVAVPVQGLDSLLIVLRSERIDYVDERTGRQIDIGYGTVSRADNSMPVDELDVEELIMQGTFSSLLDLMKGRFAGVNVGPDGSVIIRGMHTIYGSSEPLVVVDGIVQSGTFAQVESSINVHDVKTITILKDGSIYGAQGANGVIMITTKK